MRFSKQASKAFGWSSNALSKRNLIDIFCWFIRSFIGFFRNNSYTPIIWSRCYSNCLRKNFLIFLRDYNKLMMKLKEKNLLICETRIFEWIQICQIIRFGTKFCAITFYQERTTVPGKKPKYLIKRIIRLIIFLKNWMTNEFSYFTKLNQPTFSKGIKWKFFC
jgi:hypothetical protein